MKPFVVVITGEISDDCTTDQFEALAYAAQVQLEEPDQLVWPVETAKVATSWSLGDEAEDAPDAVVARLRAALEEIAASPDHGRGCQTPRLKAVAERALRNG